MNNRTVRGGGTGSSQKRYQIIESAFHLFAKQGYHATALRQIAHDAGVLPSNVYNYFDSKGAIYQSVLEQYHPWLAFHDDLTDRYSSGVKVSAFDFLQFLAAQWKLNPDGLRLHLVELLEFQGQHIAMIYSRLQGMIASFISCPRIKNRSVDQVVEQWSESAVALFYIVLLDQCLKQVETKATSRKTLLDLKTLLNLWNGDAFSETSHNHLLHPR